MTRVLSLDGGGVRGVVTAEWLGELQNHLEGPLVDRFDLVCGASTGAILAALLGIGADPKGLSDLYMERAFEIFPYGLAWAKDRFRRIFSQGISAPIYSGENFNRILRDFFGADTKFGDSKIPLVIPTYSASTGRPLIFDSKEHAELPLWEVVRASAAAPIFLPAHVMAVAGEQHILMDGGLVFNNPSLLGVMTLENRGVHQDDIEIFSLGTGESPPIKSVDLAVNGGILEWGFGLNLLPVALDAPLDAVSVLAERSYRYHRLQITLPEDFYGIDNSRPDNLRGLRQEARRNFNRVEFMADQIREE